MTHAPRRARRGRHLRRPPVVRGAPRGCRRARSTVAFCMPGRAPGLPPSCRRLPPPPCGPSSGGPDTAMRPRTNSTGRTPRGWVANSAVKVDRGPVGPIRAAATAAVGTRPGRAPTAGGRRCSSPALALPGDGDRRRRQEQGATCSSSCGPDTPAISITHEHDVTNCCSEPAPRSAAAASSTSIPAGSRPVSRPGGHATSTPAASARSSSMTTSTYSASDSHPVGRASPKLSWGRGENPAE